MATTFIDKAEARRLFALLSKPENRDPWNRDLRARLGNQLGYVMFHEFTPAAKPSERLCGVCLLNGVSKTRSQHKPVELA